PRACIPTVPGRRWRANGGQVPRYASRNPVVTASQPVSPGQSTGLAARSRTNRTAESVARLASRLVVGPGSPDRAPAPGHDVPVTERVSPYSPPAERALAR